MYKDFVSKNRSKIFFGICALSFIYIIVHLFVIEKYQYVGFKDLADQAKEHFFHLLPVMAAFFIFVIADIRERLSRRQEKSQKV